MPVESCIPIIPSADLEKSLRLWVDGLGFSMSSEMRKDDKLIFCMLRKDDLCFMLNQRAGTPVKLEDYEGIRLYWAPKDIHKTRERLKSLGYGVSELEHRDYGQTEFFPTDDDGYSHGFGVPTQGRGNSPSAPARSSVRDSGGSSSRHRPSASSAFTGQ
jgi:hypothetical protein